MGDRPLVGAGIQRYRELVEQLGRHPLYGAIRSRSALRRFMEHHVYAVWDFMSLLKALQARVAPPAVPWAPPPNARLAAFINQLVLEEESDRELGYLSHFEVYCQAMAEVGADTGPIRRLIDRVRSAGPAAVLGDPAVPDPARRFMRFTFEIIGRDQPHQLAAILAYGRELVIPDVFRSLLGGPDAVLGISPTLRRYLERHVQLDGDDHGPLSVLLLEELCGGSEAKQAEAMDAAAGALGARIELWDGIYRRLGAAD